MMLTAQLVQQLPDRQEERVIYKTLLDDSVAFTIAEPWNELFDEGSASQIVDDMSPATDEETDAAGPFGLSPDRYQAGFMRINMPRYDTAAAYD